MRIAQIIATGSLALFITGCATRQPYVYNTPNGQVISTRPAQSAADIDLDTALRAELDRYGDLAAVSPNVHIYSRDGVVNLNGTVRNERDREMIDALVRNTGGVTAVNDQLQVSYPPTSAYGSPPRVYTPAAPVVTPPPTVVPGPAAFPQVQAVTTLDQALANRIIDRLRWDAVPNSYLQNTTLTVNNGDVYLQGDVDDARAHEAILSSVQHTAGIRSIYDQLRVR